MHLLPVMHESFIVPKVQSHLRAFSNRAIMMLVQGDMLLPRAKALVVWPTCIQPLSTIVPLLVPLDWFRIAAILGHVTFASMHYPVATIVVTTDEGTVGRVVYDVLSLQDACSTPMVPGDVGS